MCHKSQSCFTPHGVMGRWSTSECEAGAWGGGQPLAEKQQVPCSLKVQMPAPLASASVSCSGLGRNA